MMQTFGSILSAIAIGIAGLGFTGCASAPSLPAPSNAASSLEQEQQRFVQAMKPRRAGKPVVAVLALNDATEMTDFLLPHAVLKRADVAEVHAVAPRHGRVTLYPALEVESAEDLDGFDRAHPSGADYVIVPAMSEDDDPAVTTWLRRQASRGARVIAVCSGARVAGRAGLLDGRRFAGHWYDRATLLSRHPGATYVPHLRYLVDGDVATTTGITASIPTLLALVEAIGGRHKADLLADELGVPSWVPMHDSRPFYLDAGRRWDFLVERAAFWRREQWRVDVHDGMDDVALALAVDAWTRTGRVSVVAASNSGAVRLRSGLILVADTGVGDYPTLPLTSGLAPIRQLDRTLCEIASRFGSSRRHWVMLEMEYPDPPRACDA
jgi:putative intracellular protease/amidase